MKRRDFLQGLSLGLLSVGANTVCGFGKDEMITAAPKEYDGALKNPLKGFRPRKRDGSHEYGTLCRVYLKWNDLERNAGDGIERILEVCSREWRDVEKHNIKVIPRVYLHWDGDKKYWPSDLQEDDYSSEKFKMRLQRLIRRLGECWNDDPRIAWMQMGMIGKWGEHHSPSPTVEMQRLLGESFTHAFPNKMITVRHPWEFADYEFGIYWDSWAHIQQMDKHGGGIEKLGLRWQKRPIGGECAYNWGKWNVQPGDNPNDTLRDPEHRLFLIDSIRRFHCSNLGWVAEYDASDPVISEGAEEVQKAFGYRFVLEKVEYTRSVKPGGEFEVAFTVRNSGSSPIYANWPVEISLMDAKSKEVIWHDTIEGLDIRQWLPGDEWDSHEKRYRKEAKSNLVRDRFELPKTVQKGEYILCIAILDPAGMKPSVRFATRNYFNGGRHPIGLLGVGVLVDNPTLNPALFDNPADDRSLHYSLAP